MGSSVKKKNEVQLNLALTEMVSLEGLSQGGCVVQQIHFFMLFSVLSRYRSRRPHCIQRAGVQPGVKDARQNACSGNHRCQLPFLWWRFVQSAHASPHCGGWHRHGCKRGESEFGDACQTAEFEIHTCICGRLIRVICQAINSLGSLGRFPQGKPAATELCYQTLINYKVHA